MVVKWNGKTQNLRQFGNSRPHFCTQALLFLYSGRLLHPNTPGSSKCFWGSSVGGSNGCGVRFKIQNGSIDSIKEELMCGHLCLQHVVPWKKCVSLESFFFHTRFFKNRRGIRVCPYHEITVPSPKNIKKRKYWIRPSRIDYPRNKPTLQCSELSMITLAVVHLREPNFWRSLTSSIDVSKMFGNRWIVVEDKYCLPSVIDLFSTYVFEFFWVRLLLASRMTS